jgi:glycosyltransferase involved in cell wall biosynthesis
MRVVALVPGDDFSGPAGQVASTSAELAKHGIELRFILLCRPAAATGRLPSFLDRRGIPYKLLEDRRPFDPGLAIRVWRLLSEWQPGILETHGYKASAIALALTRLRPQWRWVAFFHGLTTESRRARFYHWLDQRILRWADAVVAISEEQRQQLLRWAPRARVVHSAVTSLDSPSTAAHGSELGARLERSSRPRIAVVGRLSPEKGVDVFLRSAAILASRGVAFSAVIVGDGPERTELEALAASLGLRDRTQFLGHVSAISSLYDNIDMLVIPSRSEGLPSVLLEALNADVTVIATRVGAISEVLSQPDSGILVPPESPTDLAEGIERGLASLGSEVGRGARAAAADMFSQEKRASALLEVYRTVLRQPTGAKAT